MAGHLDGELPGVGDDWARDILFEWSGLMARLLPVSDTSAGNDGHYAFLSGIRVLVGSLLVISTTGINKRL